MEREYGRGEGEGKRRGPMIGKSILAGQSWPAGGVVWPAGWLGEGDRESVGVRFYPKMPIFNLERKIEMLLEMLLHQANEQRLSSLSLTYIETKF